MAKSKVKQLAEVGDRVRITLGGPAFLAGTDTASGYTTIDVDSPISLSGRVVRGDEDSWVIQLDTAYLDRNEILIPKIAVK